MLRFCVLLLILTSCSGSESPPDRDASPAPAPAADTPEASSSSDAVTTQPPLEFTKHPDAAPSPADVPPGLGVPGGWQAQAETDEVDESIEDAKPLTEDEQRRYTAIAERLVRAINDEDRTAYRALHTDEAWEAAIPWWRDMFPVQIARFGRIVKAYQPVRGMIRFGGMGFRGGDGDMVTLVVRFEEPMGAALSFELDADDKITATSVFIKGELAHYEPEDTDAALIFDES